MGQVSHPKSIQYPRLSKRSPHKVRLSFTFICFMASTNDHGLERVTRLDDKTLTALALFDTRHLVWISVILVILTNLIGLLNAVGSIIRES